MKRKSKIELCALCLSIPPLGPKDARGCHLRHLKVPGDVLEQHQGVDLQL